MELGISAYEKIRRGLIDESIFGELTYEIKKLDLEIYNRMLDIANIEGHDEHTPICECQVMYQKIMKNSALIVAGR